MELGQKNSICIQHCWGRAATGLRYPVWFGSVEKHRSTCYRFSYSIWVSSLCGVERWRNGDQCEKTFVDLARPSGYLSGPGA